MGPVTEDHDDNFAVVPFHHVGQYGLGGVPDALDIDVDMEIPVLIGHIEEGTELAHARVVDEDVDTAIGGDNLVHGSLKAGLVRDVHGDGHGFQPGVVEFPGDGFGLVRASGGQDHGRALLCHHAGNALANAHGSPRYKCDFLIQFTHVSLSLYE